MTSEQVSCPKCGVQYPSTDMFQHYKECKGTGGTTIPQQPQSFVWQEPQQQQVTTIQTHHHTWIESDMYKVCPGCNHISPKLKALWFIFIRYFFAVFWIALFIGVLIGIKVHG